MNITINGVADPTLLGNINFTVNDNVILFHLTTVGFSVSNIRLDELGYYRITEDGDYRILED